MDMNDLRALSTVLMFITFLGIIAWAAIGGRDRFKDAANLPFVEEDSPPFVEEDSPNTQQAEKEKSS